MTDLDPDGELDVLAEVARRTMPYLEGDAPVFGSPEWLALEAGDPRVTQAVVRAALAWWRMAEPLEDLEARAAAAEDKASAVAISTAIRDSRRSGVYYATYAELVRRRTSPTTRDGDFPGGRVNAWGPGHTTGTSAA